MALKSIKETNSSAIKNKTDDKPTTEKSQTIVNKDNISKTNTNKYEILSKLDAKNSVSKRKTVKIRNAPNSESCYLTSNTMATYYTQYQIPQAYTFPIFTEWSPIVSTVQVPLYTSPVQPLPVTILTPQVITPVCPYTGVLVTTEPIVATVPQNTIISDVIPTLCNNMYTESKYELNYTDEHIETFNNQISIESKPKQTEVIREESNKVDPIEFYLTLPKELFPSPRMFAIDPNAIIDEFCKITNINDNVPWILDLEFGVPRVLVTRAIAVYDVKFNSIHCKNTPSAIHPGFEKCNDDFKKVILFYYDCIVSTWYNSYIILNYDKSVENFQSWLLIPMQIFGMCWP